MEGFMTRPYSDEEFNDYLIRFISDQYAILEFPNIDQRMAVAKTIFETHEN